MNEINVNTQVKVNLYLDVGELTSRKLAKRLRTLANESLAKRLIGEMTGYHVKEL